MDARDPTDDRLDSAVEETFPASDPPANTVETGLVATPLDRDSAVRDNRDARRFEYREDGHTAWLAYETFSDDALVLVQTEVPPPLGGRHLEEILLRAALDAAKNGRRHVVALCPFVRRYLETHPELDI